MANFGFRMQGNTTHAISKLSSQKCVFCTFQPVLSLPLRFSTTVLDCNVTARAPESALLFALGTLFR
jgi:hypothetical protein